MKCFKIICTIGFCISVIICIDLGINYAAALLPDLWDGVSYNSILQSSFGVLEQLGINSRLGFFRAFEQSLWICSALFFLNVALYIHTIISKK